VFLHSIALVKTLPCLAEPGKIIAVGEPDRSLTDVIPFLANLPGVIAYNPETLSLTFRRPRGFMTIYSDKITITQVADADEGIRLFVALKEAINATWERRAQLPGVSRRKRTPRPLDIWTLLPRTNCTKCNEATCMAFAVAVLQGKRAPADCPVLGVDQREAVAALIA
jgi:ArsR family metal-binding transcriptional regulator